MIIGLFMDNSIPTKAKIGGILLQSDDKKLSAAICQKTCLFLK